MLRCAIRGLVDQQQQWPTAGLLQLQRQLRALHTAVKDLEGLEGASGTAAAVAAAASEAASSPPGVAAALAGGNDATHLLQQQQQQHPVQQQVATWLAAAAAGGATTPSAGASRLPIRAYCPVLADAVRSLEQQQPQQQQQQQQQHQQPRPGKYKHKQDRAQPAGGAPQHPAALQASAALQAHRQAAAREILSSTVQQLVEQPAELAATGPGAICSLLLACRRAQVVLPASHIQQLLHAAAQGTDQLNFPLIVQALYAAARCIDAAAQPQQRLPAEAHPLLHRALQQLLQQLPAVSPKAISQLLALHEKARTQVSPASMQALLQHAVQPAYLSSASLLDMQWMLRAASYSSLLALPAGVDLTPLLSALALAGQQRGGQPGPASAPLAALRAASTLQAALPSGLLQQLLGQALQACSPAARRKGAGLLPAGDAAALFKALSCLPPRLLREIQRPQLQQLLQAHLQQALAQQQAGLEHVGGMLASMMRLQVDLPASLLDATLAQVMELLVQLAHAPADGPASRDTTTSSSNTSGASGSAGRAAAAPELSAKAMSELLRALTHSQRVLPADAVAPLTARFLSREPGVKAISRWTAALAGMGHALSSEQLQALLQRMLQPQHQRTPQRYQPRQQQGQRLFMAAMDANDVGNFLWGVATMGFTLEAPLLQLLLQHQLQRLRPPWTYGLTQSLWAMAAMGAAEDAAAGSGSLCPVAEELLQQALDALLQEQQAASGLAGSQVVGATHFSGPTDADDFQADAAADNAGRGQLVDPASNSSRSSSRAWPAVFWQWSIAAWSVALLDAQSCKPQVLQLCRVLAQPHIWQGLRTHEHVQLLWVHLWLCGYQWSTTEGLAGILSAEQLRQVQRARQQQAQNLRRQGRDRHAAWLSRVQQNQQQNQQQQQQQPGLRPPPQGASNTQFYLHAMARRMPGVASAELEALTDDGLFDVDVAVVTRGGLRLALEYDGPWHFSLPAPTPAAGGTSADTAASSSSSSNLGGGSGAVQGGASGAAAAAWAARAWAVGGAAHNIRPQQLGDDKQQQQQVWLATRTTLFRNRALAARGYRVVAVPFFRWPDSTEPLGRQQLVARLIAEAVHGSSSSSSGGSGNSRGTRRPRCRRQ